LLTTEQSLVFKPATELRLYETNIDEVWRHWKQKFDNFMTAFGYNLKPDAVLLSMLLSVIDDEALRLDWIMLGHIRNTKRINWLLF